MRALERARVVGAPWPSVAPADPREYRLSADPAPVVHVRRQEVLP
jgi:hypothetical protein